MIILNSKTGIKETSASAVFTMLPMLIIHYIGQGISVMNSGYWINFLICSLFSLVLVRFCKSGLCSETGDNRILAKLTAVVLIISAFSFTARNYSLCTDAINSVSSGLFTREILSFLPCFAAVICALLGIEGLTRCSYISFIIIGTIFLFMCVISFKGWDVNNFYPILGNDIKTTLSDVSSLGVFGSALSIYAIAQNLNSGKDSYRVIKRSILTVSVSGLFLTLICILSVPYPMGELYPFSLAGIFSIADSGSFFHRFEILLLFMLIIIDILSLAVGIYYISHILARLTKSGDYKPYSLILGVILFYLNQLSQSSEIYFGIYVASSVVLIAIFLCKSVIISFKLRKESA